jgi:hypothetical protein
MIATATPGAAGGSAARSSTRTAPQINAIDRIAIGASSGRICGQSAPLPVRSASSSVEAKSPMQKTTAAVPPSAATCTTGANSAWL